LRHRAEFAPRRLAGRVGCQAAGDVLGYEMFDVRAHLVAQLAIGGVSAHERANAHQQHLGESHTASPPVP
jgi:hypothetical protein